jgi:hypothetical protein
LVVRQGSPGTLEGTVQQSCIGALVPCEDHKDVIKWLNDPKKHLLYALSQETSSRGRGKNKHEIYSVQLCCSHSRKYEDSSKGKNKHGSRMSSCPFRATLKPYTTADYEKGWLLTVTNPLHNHPAIGNPLGVPHFRKLDKQSIQIIKYGMQIGCPSAEMLKELLNLGKNCTLKDINNLRQKYSWLELSGSSRIQAVLQYLEDYTNSEGEKYFYCIKMDEGNRVNTLFFAYPLMDDVVKANCEVLLIDCTYKVNQFNMPFLHITSFTSTGQQFDVGYCFMPGEKEHQYKIAVQYLREYLDSLGVLPKVAIIDWEVNLKNAMQEEFPTCKQRMCSWHLNKLILVEAIKAWDIRRASDDKESKEIDKKHGNFMKAYERLRQSPTEKEFDNMWELMKSDYSEYPALLQYMESWLDVREQWAEYHCRIFRDYSNHCNSPHEGAHRVVKHHMTMPKGHLYNVVKDIHLMLKSWKNEYIAKLMHDRSRIPTALSKVYELKNVHFIVTTTARFKVAEQLKLAKDLNYTQSCTGGFTATCRLPCKHTLHRQLDKAGSDLVLLPEDFAPYWWYQLPYMGHLELLPVIPQDPLMVKGKGRLKGVMTTVTPTTQRDTVT